MTRYLQEEPIRRDWKACDIRNTGFPKYDLIQAEYQLKTFPELNRQVIVKVLTKTKDILYYSTLFETDLIRRHCLIKWRVTHWSYE